MPTRHQVQARELVDEALLSLDSMHDLLEADARESDRTGAIGPQATVALQEAGVFRLAVGGRIGVGALARIGAGIAQYHPSAAWNCIVSLTNELLAQQFVERSGFELPHDPDRQWCGVFASPNAGAEPNGDGHLVTGTWAYASNSETATWALLNIAHAELGPAFVLVPRCELSSRHDWASIGLRGTGSHTLFVDGLQVPEERLLTSGVLYQEDPAGPFGLRVPSRLRTAFGLASVALGAADALQTALIDSVAGETGGVARMPRRGSRGVDRPGLAITVGEVVSRLTAARVTLFDVADDLDHTVSAEGSLSPQRLVAARLMLSRLARDAADAAHEISLIAGSRGCLEQNEVGRLWRDAHTAARHAALAPAVGFDLGGRAEIDPSTIDAAAAAGPLAPAKAAGPA